MYYSTACWSWQNDCRSHNKWHWLLDRRKTNTLTYFKYFWLQSWSKTCLANILNWSASHKNIQTPSLDLKEETLVLRAWHAEVRNSHWLLMRQWAAISLRECTSNKTRWNRRSCAVGRSLASWRKHDWVNSCREQRDTEYNTHRTSTVCTVYWASLCVLDLIPGMCYWDVLSKTVRRLCMRYKTNVEKRGGVCRRVLIAWDRLSLSPCFLGCTAVYLGHQVFLWLTLMRGSSRDWPALTMASLDTALSPLAWISSTAI